MATAMVRRWGREFFCVERFTARRLFLLAVALRLLVVVIVHDWESPNAWEYGVVADNVLAGKGFSGSAWLVPEGNTAFMAPAYVYTLCAFRIVFGTWAYALLQLAQGCIGALCAVLTFRIAARVFDKQTGVVAGLLLAVYPTHAFMSTLIHPLLLIATILMGVVLLSIKLSESLNLRTGIFLGLVMGLGMLTDPALLCFVPFAVAVPFLMNLKQWKRALCVCAAAACLMVAVIAPWTYRNYLVFDRFVPVKSQLGYIIWVGNHDGATGTQTLIDEDGKVKHVNDHIPDEEREILSGMIEPDAYNYLGKKALDYMVANPGETIQRTVKKALYFWWFPSWLSCPVCASGGLLTQFHHAEKTIWLPVLGMGIAGVVMARKKWRRVFFLLLPMASYTALYAISNVGSNSRYRIPVEPLVVIFAALAVVWFSTRRSNSR